MDLASIDIITVIDVFLLLLIGVGPKIALVPFLEISAKMDDRTKGRVVRRMLTTAFITALLLIVFGGLLTKLLHFSTGALAVAGGVILLVISISMILSGAEGHAKQEVEVITDPLSLAVFPLAVPYLLNPAGIVTLITVSAEAGSLGILIMVVLLLAVVLGVDIVVFRWAKQVSAHLDASRMLVTEKVFGFLLAALAVQLVLEGLADVGVIHLAAHAVH
jgi:small neutral amino acid transporter SnatA (MarC family)